jgi:adenylate cyclase
MASVIQGYEYDIFISYRQKDNKGGRQGAPLFGATQFREAGWVSEFVEALKTELESTFKEEISVYFDINPRDGLLETHDVNASLKEKLKCLVFIPIISQTYCDPRSFAWQHEFCAFNKLVKEDQFGRDIKLSSGNVASRILPVKIHDLDIEDKALLENELGGVLRCIEFIYKEPGVNRSLKPSDNKNDNQNKTDYRNQVNKIANAIKDIIGGLKNPSLSIVIPVRKDSSNIFKSNPEAFESIAVLPFANMSSDPEQEFFSDGISEEIINMLAQVPGLKVAGRTSAFSFKGKNQDLRLIGELLNVNHILEGSVRKSGNKIRITAQLIKVADGYHLWSEKYDRQLEDIFDIQDEISLAILNAIKIKLFGATKEAVLKKYTDNPEAYQLYLQGRFYYNRYDNYGFEKAIEHFEDAIKIEPRYALAYAGMAYSYFSLWFFNYLPPDSCLPQMNQAIKQSLHLDNEIAESHIVMARMKFYYEWDFAASVIEFKKAIELNPNIVDAHVFYAICLGFLGNYTEAIKHASIVYSLDPFSLYNNLNVAVVYMMAGDYEKELEYGRKLIELEPNYFGGHYHVGIGLMNLKRYEEAVTELEIAVHQNYGSFTLHYLGILYGVMEEKVKARKVLEKMRNLASTKWVSNCDFGDVYMALGEFEEAFKYFEKSIEIHEGRMFFSKYNFRFFPAFEQDPRTKQLLEKIGLPYP